MGQPESHDSFDFIYLAESEIEVLGEAMPPEDTSEMEVLGEAVPPEDTSRFVPPTEERALGVTEVGEVGAATETLGLASPSLITALKPQEASSGLSLLLWRGDNEVPSGMVISSKDWKSSRWSH